MTYGRSSSQLSHKIFKQISKDLFNYQHSHILLQTCFIQLTTHLVLIIPSLSFLTDKNTISDTHSHLQNVEPCINCRWKWAIVQVSHPCTSSHTITYLHFCGMQTFSLLWQPQTTTAHYNYRQQPRTTTAHYNYRLQPQTTATDNSHVQLYFPTSSSSKLFQQVEELCLSMVLVVTRAHATYCGHYIWTAWLVSWHSQ